MSSMIYQIAHQSRFEEVRKLLAERDRLRGSGAALPEKLANLPTRTTLKQYQNHTIKFAKWCRKTYGCKTFKQTKKYIQAYSDYLQSKPRPCGKPLSASTIHTYLAGPCFAHKVDMEDIKKPLRYASDFTRSRGQKAYKTRTDASGFSSPRLAVFQSIVGIRRAECGHLKGKDFRKNADGSAVVIVRKGKGGKPQEQLIPPDKVSLIESYFDGSDSYVFSKNELKNKLDLHRQRQLRAWNDYQDYVKKLEADPAYRDKLLAQVRKRFMSKQPKKWDKKKVVGTYRLRGKNLQLALEAGFPIEYDRLALMAVSVFDLSHWRNDVTISNYILAVAKDIVMRR